MSDSVARMIDVDEAQRIVLSVARPLPAVDLALMDAANRTLARPITCDVDYPPFDRSVMDGFAVRAADVETTPVTLRVVEEIAAGRMATRRLGAGEAMRINTGAPIPDGADAVVRVEHTSSSEDGSVSGGANVVVNVSAVVGKFITRRASCVHAGQIALASGVRLTPLALAAAAAAGASRVTVHRQPTVALLVTGDELIDIDRVPVGAQIRDSNLYLLDALVRSAQARPVPMGAVGDDRDLLAEKITTGFDADVLCITGGISMGSLDFVPEVLQACGVTFLIHKMAIKPGRPVIVGTTSGGTASGGTLVFALPGNPMSAFVGFELLVRPALAALEGRDGQVLKPMTACLHGSLSPTRDRRTFRPSRAWVEKDGRWHVEPLSWQGSGDPLGAAEANAMIVQPPDAPGLSRGDSVAMMLLDRS